MSPERAIHCPSCGYDLRASVREDGSALCAECGTLLDAMAVYWQRETSVIGSWTSMGRLTIPGAVLAIFATFAVSIRPDASIAIPLAGLACLTLLIAGIAGFAWYHGQEREASALPRAVESATFGVMMMVWNVGVGVAGLGLFASILSVFGADHF